MMTKLHIPPSSPERAYNKLNSKSYKSAMTSYYRKSKILPKIPLINKKVAWVTSGAPVEFLVAGGVIALYPENYAAILGVSKTSVQACKVAENEGYSNELCSYARCHLGTVFRPSESLMNGLSKPDFLVSSNNICGTVVKWFQTISEYYNVPHFHFDTPPITGTQESHVFHYVRKQIDEYIEWIESQLGKKLNQNKMLETFESSRQATDLWIQILASCKNKPSPLNCPDRFITMAPIVTQRGLKQTIKVYQELLSEVQTRVISGIGAIKKEKHRLLWDNIAIWYYLYPFFNQLAKKGVVFPVDTYTNAWAQAVSGEDIDTALNAAAKVYSHVYLNQDLDYRIKLISRLIKEYSIDGFVLHSNKACKRYSMGMLSYKKAIADQTGVPGVIVDGDMVDSRNFSEEQTWTRIESFVELLENKKGI
jgi:benzoyl-CoA reductase/2-hydroxyglutaryl-CoA dehydratase subunit BcrC/BadD/HgdB